jgi:hypothetical protein
VTLLALFIDLLLFVLLFFQSASQPNKYKPDNKPKTETTTQKHRKLQEKKENEEGKRKAKPGGGESAVEVVDWPIVQVGQIRDFGNHQLAVVLEVAQNLVALSRKGKERKESKGKESKGKERKGKERRERESK